MLDFNQYALQSYGGFQDWNSSASIQDSGQSLSITGNGWKKIDFAYDVTANTVLEFQFKSTKAGEVHGIGFDTDDSLSRDRVFQLYGTQSWGISDFRNYSPDVSDDGWVTYRIPVGQFYTGSMQYLTFANDHDVFFPSAESLFRNVRVFEGDPISPPANDEQPLDLTQYSITSYGGQDRGPSAVITDAGSTAELQGNNWKKLAFPYDVTADTMLEFQFRSGREGEIHGIGFDSDNSLSSNRTFKLHGTQNWGLRQFDNYGDGADGGTLGEWTSYTIPVGDFFTGDMAYLTLVNDHDVSNPTAESLFRDIRVYEKADVLPQPGTIGFTTSFVNVTEGEEAVLVVTREGGSDGAVSVDIRQAAGDAVAGEDFAASLLPITVTFADGETGTQIINLPTLDDVLYEPGGETLRLELVNETGGVAVVGSTVDIAIADNDPQPPVIFQAGNLSGVKSFADVLASDGPDHAYRFSVSETSDVNVILEGLTANADLVLRRADGTLLDDAVLKGAVLDSSANGGARTEVLAETLAAGDYVLQIEAGGGTDYDLILSATPDVADTSHQLAVSTATYLGGFGDDTAAAVEVSPRNELLLVGNFSASQSFGPAQAVLGATTASPAQLVRLSASGRDVLSVTHLGGDVNDLAINAAGNIVVGGDFGVAVLNPTGEQVLWSQGPGSLGGNVSRVAIADDGTVVTLSGKTVTTWTGSGQQIAQHAQVRSYVNDVEIHPQTNQVYVTGFDNKRNALDSNNPVQVAYVNAFNPTNLETFQWQNWGFDGNTLTSNGQNDMADTRGYRVSIGDDGQLYFLGEVAGGNSIFRWNGRDRSTPTLVKYDAYNDPYNSKSPHQVYYARLDPTTGAIDKGQLAFARLNGDTSAIANAFRVENGAIAADESGNIYISGQGFSKIKDRDINQINGQTVGPYTKSDLTALVVANDFQSRRLWTPFTENVGRGNLQGIAVGNGRTAVLGSVSQGTVITTDDAINPDPFNLNPFSSSDSGSLQDVYLATWGTDTQDGFVSLQAGTDGADVLVGGRSGDLFVGAGGSDRLTGNGGSDAFRYDTPGDGGDTITDFGSDDEIRLLAQGFGLVAGASITFGSVFRYSQGVLSFDADGFGGGGAVAIATLQGSPNLNASQIRIV